MSATDPNRQTNNQLQRQWVSVGYRCTSAGILKSIQQKFASYPFDWMITKPSVIQHAIQDDFHAFLNPDNYVSVRAQTFSSIEDINPQSIVCDEQLMVNQFYDTHTTHQNAYLYNCAHNHHSLHNNDDYEYYKRCVQRFRDLTVSPSILFISPIYSRVTEQFRLPEQLKEMQYVYDAFCKVYPDTNGIFIYMYKNMSITDACYINEIEPCGNIRQYTCYTPPDIIDAGEIFMGNCAYVIKTIQNIVKHYE